MSICANNNITQVQETTTIDKYTAALVSPRGVHPPRLRWAWTAVGLILGAALMLMQPL